MSPVGATYSIWLQASGRPYGALNPWRTGVLQIGRAYGAAKT